MPPYSTLYRALLVVLPKVWMAAGAVRTEVLVQWLPDYSLLILSESRGSVIVPAMESL